MFWFRSNTRFGARLALVALAVQIVLSFGHVHLYGFTLASAKASPAAMADAAVVVPANAPKSDGSAGADCAICALIQVSAAAMPAAAAALPLPSNLDSSWLSAPLALALAASPHFLFQARAPPAI